MNGPRSVLPTLTEVVQVDDAAQPPGGVAHSPTCDDEALQRRVVEALQRRFEPLLEVRIREALAPALARATEVLLEEARGELSLALRQLVAQAAAEFTDDPARRAESAGGESA